MEKRVKIVKIPNQVSDEELVKIIDEYSEEGYKVTVNSNCKSKGYTELILK